MSSTPKVSMYLPADLGTAVAEVQATLIDAVKMMAHELKLVKLKQGNENLDYDDARRLSDHARVSASIYKELARAQAYQAVAASADDNVTDEELMRKLRDIHNASKAKAAKVPAAEPTN